jgi:hypothetical protein
LLRLTGSVADEVIIEKRERGPRKVGQNRTDRGAIADARDAGDVPPLLR